MKELEQLTLEKVKTVLTVLVLLTFFSSFAIIASETSSYYLNKYHETFSNSALSIKEQNKKAETLLFEINSDEHPKIATLTYVRLMLLAATDNKEKRFQQLKEQLVNISLPANDQRVINFLSALAQVELYRRSNKFILAINQGEKLKQQLSTFTLHPSKNIENNILSVNKLNSAQLFNSLGNSYFSTSDYEEAQKYFFDAMEIYQQDKNIKGQAAVYTNLAMISWAQKNYQAALDQTDKALTLSKQVSDERSFINNLLNQGIYYENLKQYDNAVATFQKVAKHPNINQYPQFHIKALLAKADTMQLVGEYKQSEQLIQQALLISTSTQNHFYLNLAKISLGKQLIQQQKYDQAQTILLEANRYFTDNQVLREQSIALHSLSQLHRVKGETNLALSYYEQFSSVELKILKNAQKSSIISLNEQYQADARNKQIKLLEQESLLNQEKIRLEQNQKLYILLVSIAGVIIISLWSSKYYSRRETSKITEHSLAIAENEKQLTLLSHAFKNASDAMWITDANFKIEAVNNAFVQHTHKTKAEVIGKKVSFANVHGQDDMLAERIMLQVKLSETWQGEIYDQRSNEEIYPIELEIEAIKNENDEIIHYLGVFKDITERKQTQEQLTKLATHDDLTNLPNRTLLEQLIKQSCLNSKHTSKSPTLLMFDVNNFKTINDSYGHNLGDLLIRQIAERLSALLFSKDVIARLSGAEFCILAELNDPKRSAARVAQKILSAFEAPFNLENSNIHVSASVGITVYPEDGDKPQELLRKAAVAMLGVKNIEGQHYRFFEQNMNNAATQQLEQEQKILNAINNEQFDFYYQPLVDTQTDEITGAEALIRWVEPDGTIIPPNDFIPIAEQAGFIDQIDRIAINKVFKQMANWQKAGQNVCNISINISAKMFEQANELLTLLRAKLSQYEVNPINIKLEITESMLLHNIERAIDTMNDIKSLGFQLSLDDFGTGFSSLNYLKKFPIDFLKIDRSFISGMHESAVDRNIVKAIISLAHTLDLKVVGEGIELPQHLSELKKMNCEQYQGYLYSKPLPLDAFEALLVTRTLQPANSH